MGQLREKTKTTDVPDFGELESDDMILSKLLNLEANYQRIKKYYTYCRNPDQQRCDSLHESYRIDENEELKRAFKVLDNLVDHFEKRWKNEEQLNGLI